MVDFVKEVLVRFRDVEAVDRALAFAAKLFIAFVPLLMVAGSIAPGRGGYGDRLVERFELEEPAAGAMRQLFAGTGEVRGGLTFFSVVLLLISAMSLGRAFQRLFERLWNLPPSGPRHAWRAISWIVGFAVVITVAGLLRSAAHGYAGAWLSVPIALLVNTALWIWTPFLLLGQRVERWRLVPSAALTAIAVSLYSAASAIWLPGADRALHRALRPDRHHVHARLVALRRGARRSSRASSSGPCSGSACKAALAARQRDATVTVTACTALFA